EPCLLRTAAATPQSLTPSQDPPASASSPATTSGRSGQWWPGAFHGRSIISSRFAPISTGQRCSGRRKITNVHIHALASRPAKCGTVVPCGIDRNGNAMPTLADREKEFEARFKHDHEFKFKATARRNRLLGLWAAQRLGLLGDAAEDYAKRVVAAQFEPGGDKHVVNKEADDLGAQDPTLTHARILFELEHFAKQAKQQLMKE